MSATRTVTIICDGCGLNSHLTDTIASEVLRQKAVAWDEGKAAGLRQSDWEHGDTARMYIARNPYYATPPTTTEETTHE